MILRYPPLTLNLRDDCPHVADFRATAQRVSAHYFDIAEDPGLLPDDTYNKFLAEGTIDVLRRWYRRRESL